MDIGKTFLHYAENGSFHFGGEAPKIGAELEVDRNPASFRKSFHKPLKGGGQTRLIQQRRMQQVRYRA